MQTSMLKMPMRTTCVEDELEDLELDKERLPSWFPVFRGWKDLEAGLNRAEEDYKFGRYKPADEALAEIRNKYNL